MEAYASSTCEMVSESLQYIDGGVRIKVEEADCMYSAMMIDTNNFMTKTGVRTFEAVSYTHLGQLQIIFGTGTVNKVYEEFVRIAGIQSASKEEVKQAASAKTSIWKRAIKMCIRDRLEMIGLV